MDLLFSTFHFLLILAITTAPPPRRPSESNDSENSKPAENFDAYKLDYSPYLEKIVKLLESETKFQDRLKSMPEADIKSGKIADHFDEIGPDMKQQLNQIKKIEIERIRQSLSQQIKKDGGMPSPIFGVHNVDVPEHLDITNWETFGKDDLRKLIRKVVADMDEVDRSRKEDFKQYEMRKQAEQDRRHSQMNETERREAVEGERRSRMRHNEHEKVLELNHPGSRDQFEEVWEDKDGLDKENFDPRTFFNMHDLNNDGFWNQHEVDTLFLTELDKVYSDMNPDDDPNERMEEMNRMREHVINQMDKNNDNLVSYDEFMQDSEAQTKGDGNLDWADINDEEMPYTKDELENFEEEYARERGWGDSAYSTAIPTTIPNTIPPTVIHMHRGEANEQNSVVPERRPVENEQQQQQQQQQQVPNGVDHNSVEPVANEHKPPAIPSALPPVHLDETYGV